MRPKQASPPQLVADLAVTSDTGHALATLAQPQSIVADDMVLLSDDEEPGAVVQAAGASTAVPTTGLTMPASQVSVASCQHCWLL